MHLKKNTVDIKKILVRTLLASGFILMMSCGPDISSDEYLGRALVHLDQGDNASAIIELKNALVKQPRNIEARFQLGLVYLKTGNFVLANKELARAVEHGLAPHDGYLNMARAALRLKLKSDVEEYLAHSEASWPPAALVSVDALRAQLLLTEQKVYAAEKILSQITEVWSDHPDALYATALLESSKKRFANAEKILAKLLLIDADYAQAMELSADLSFVQGDYLSAEKSYFDARRLEPGNRELGLKLAQVYLADEQIEQAASELDRLLAEAPDSWYVQYLRSLASLRQKKYQEGLVFSETALRLEPKHLPSAFVASLTAVGAGRYETARSHLDVILAVLPRHTQTLKLKSYIELMDGGLADGLEALDGVSPERFVESDVALLLLAGEYALAKGNSTLAHDYLNKAAGLDKSNKQVMMSRAKMALRRGDYETGIDNIFSAEQQKDDPKLALYIRGAKLLARSHIVEVRKIAEELKNTYADSPEGLILEGMSYAVVNDYDNALLAFNKALAIDPANVTAKSNLAVIARKEGKLKEARDLWQGVLDLKQDKLQALFQLYEIELGLGNNAAAITWLERAYQAHPAQNFIAKTLSQYYLKSNQLERAVAVVEQSLALVPSNLDLLLFAGDLMQVTGKRQASIEYFSRALAVAPQNVTAYYRLAALFENLGQFDKMQGAADKVLELDASHVGARLMVGRQALRVGQVEMAKRHLSVLRANRVEPDLITELEAQIALTSGDMEGARKLFSALLEKKRSSILVNQYAITLWNTQRRAEAVELLDSWVLETPSDPRSLQRLVSYHISEQQLAKAESKLRALLEFAPTPGNRNNLAWLLLEQGKLDDALRQVQQALVQAPNNPRFKDTLAMIYYGKKNYAEAARYIQDALSTEPSNAEFTYHLAQIRARDGGKQEARQILEALTRRSDINGPLQKDIADLLIGL